MAEQKIKISKKIQISIPENAIIHDVIEAINKANIEDSLLAISVFVYNNGLMNRVEKYQKLFDEANKSKFNQSIKTRGEKWRN